MESGQFYWTVVVAAVSGAWILAQFVRDRLAAEAACTSALMARLVEIDLFLIDRPEVQRYMSLSAGRSEDHFTDPAVLQDDLYYKAKTFAYLHLNIFDGLLSAAKHSRKGPRLLTPPGVIELADWEEYIKRKLRHPLYHSIMNREGEIFGEALREFWTLHKASIEQAPRDPFIW